MERFQYNEQRQGKNKNFEKSGSQCKVSKQKSFCGLIGSSDRDIDVAGTHIVRDGLQGYKRIRGRMGKTKRTTMYRLVLQVMVREEANSHWYNARCVLICSYFETVRRMVQMS